MEIEVLYWQMAVVGLLIVVNGFFAMSELAVVSAREGRLRRMANDGRKGARTALALSKEPTAFLSTVQVGISLVAIVSGAYSGSTFAGPLAQVLSAWGLASHYAYPVAFGLVVVATTYLSLIIGELVPKRLALNRAEAIACLVAPLMKVLSIVGAPVVWFLTTSTEFVLKLLRVKPNPDSGVTEEDVRSMIAEGTKTGVFEHAEHDLLDGVMRVADRNVRSIMVPRTDTVWVSIEDSVKEIMTEVRQSGHSRFPVCHADVDDVVGVLHVKALVTHDRAPTPADIEAAIREPIYVNETMRILTLLERFRHSTVHMAIVLDEYGAFEGIVTPMDILAAIAGDLPEHEGDDEPEAVQRSDGSWLMDGAMSVEAAERVLQTVSLAERGDFVTFAGFVLNELGHIPEAGDSFDFRGWRFEVVDLDGRRIDKVMASRLGREETAD